MKYDGIIFDLDGTLWDAVEEGHLVLLEYLKTQPDVTHLPTKEEYDAYAKGKPFPRIRRRDGPWYGRSGGEAVPVPFLRAPNAGL